MFSIDAEDRSDITAFVESRKFPEFCNFMNIFKFMNRYKTFVTWLSCNSTWHICTSWYNLWSRWPTIKHSSNSTTITITWSHVRHLLIKALSWNWDCKVHQDIKDSVSMTLSCHCSTRLPVLNEPVDNLQTITLTFRDSHTLSGQ
jgi:hypothetical protein